MRAVGNSSAARGDCLFVGPRRAARLGTGSRRWRRQTVIVVGYCGQWWRVVSARGLVTAGGASSARAEPAAREDVAGEEGEVRVAVLLYDGFTALRGRTVRGAVPGAGSDGDDRGRAGGTSPYRHRRAEPGGRAFPGERHAGRDPARAGRGTARDHGDDGQPAGPRLDTSHSPPDGMDHFRVHGVVDPRRGRSAARPARHHLLGLPPPIWRRWAPSTPRGASSRPGRS